MSTTQLYVNLYTHWNKYGKQAFVAAMVLLFLATMVDPSITVYANGATSNAGG